MDNIILKLKENDCNYTLIKPVPTKFIFNINNTWGIEISEEGIKFNREIFPESSADHFANAFIGILENNYKMSFTKI